RSGWAYSASFGSGSFGSPMPARLVPPTSVEQDRAQVEPAQDPVGRLGVDARLPAGREDPLARRGQRVGLHLLRELASPAQRLDPLPLLLGRRIPAEQGLHPAHPLVQRGERLVRQVVRAPSAPNPPHPRASAPSSPTHRSPCPTTNSPT